MEVKKLNDSLAFNISRASLLLRRHLIQILKEYQISPEQWTILGLLYDEQVPLKQKDIADQLYKDKHAVSRMIASLEQNHWVERSQSEKDKRVQRVRISSKGIEIRNEMQEKLSESIKAQVFNHFGQDEKDQMLEFMKRIRVLLGDQLDLS